MHRTAGLAIALALVAAAAGLGQGPAATEAATEKAPAAAVAESGRAALAQGAYEEARADFERELAAAEQRGDRAAVSDLLFYLGLTEQQRAGLATADPERQRLLEESVRFYRGALEARSGLEQPLGPTLNNLGRVYADLGWNDAARDILKRALDEAGNDPRRPLYAKGYARQLVATGNWREGATWYRTVLEAWPQDAEAHEALVALYRERAPEELPGYLWWLIERGQVDSAQAAAITALKKGVTQEVGAWLLGVVAGTLAEQYGAPDRFEESSAWKELAPLRTNESIGPGVSELERLYAGRDLRPDSYRWWKMYSRLAPGEKPSPSQAFRQLAVAIGRWHERGATPVGLALAERYFVLANRLEPEPDPVAMFELADLYVQAGRTEDLKRLSEQSRALFGGKGKAYQRGDWHAVFDFHRALGLLYGMTENWGNSSTPDSAIFQIEHAQTAAEKYNRERPAGTKPLAVPPQLVALLGYGYEETGRADDAQSLKAEAAAEYRKMGDKKAAEWILSGPSSFKEKLAVVPPGVY